jgi:hypothetical protein
MLDNPARAADAAKSNAAAWVAVTITCCRRAGA